MKLTKKKALDISIELWTWLAESGSSSKYKWEGWDKYGQMEAGCPLCEYAYQQDGHGYCDLCPLYSRYSHCCDTAYLDWFCAKTTPNRKKYANKFLKQLRELRGEVK